MMKKRIAAIIILMLSGTIVFCQSSYKSIGGGLKYYAPTTSEPIDFYNYQAQAVGLFFEYYNKSHWKLNTNIDYFHTTFDTNYPSRAKRYSVDGVSHYISVYLLSTYDILRKNINWEFLAGGGYAMFMNVKSQEDIYDGGTLKTEINNNRFTKNYFIIEVSGRHKFENHLIVGFGAKSYHFLKLNNQKSFGFPSLSIEAQWGFVF